MIDVQHGPTLGALGVTLRAAIERGRRGRRYLTVYATVGRRHCIASVRVW
jgi:hypothetical protein